MKCLLFDYRDMEQPFFENREGVYLFNPGSLGAKGNYGIIEIKENEICAEHKTL